MTVTFPRPSKMLITRLQDGGSMRSAVKLSLADELHSEFVPTEVTICGHVLLLRHRPRDRGNLARRMNYCRHRPPHSCKGSPNRHAGFVLYILIAPRRYYHCHDVRAAYWIHHSRVA